MIWLFILSSLVGTTLSTPVTFVAGPPVAPNSTFTASPNTVVANGAPSPTSITLAATARDVRNNASSNVAVTLFASGSSNTFGQTTGATDANGFFSTTLASSLAQSENVTVTFGAGLSLTVPIQIVAGPVNATNSSFMVNPNTQTANGTNTILATVTVQDAQHNPLVGQTATFSADGTSTSFSSSGPTSTAGQATATFQTTFAQNENVKVSTAGLAYTALVTFIAGPATTANSHLTLSPNTLSADGNAKTTLTVSLADNYNNVIANQHVAFVAAGGAGPFAYSGPTTNAAGTLTNTLKSSFAGISTAFAHAQNITLSANANFTLRTAYCATNPNYVTNPVTGQTSPSAIVVGDVNADGNQDVAILNYAPSGSSGYYEILTVYLGTGSDLDTASGGVNTQVDAANNWGIYGLAFADYNEDGRSDAVLSNMYVNTISIMLGSGLAGKFAAPVSYAVGTTPLALCAGDFDGDGHQDVAVPNSADGTISVLLGQGTGVLNAAVTYFVGTQPRACVAGDLNNDGLLDLVVANYGSNNVSVLLNNGSGGFQTAVNYSVGSGPSFYNFGIGDLNRDGKLDVAVPNYNGANLSILINSGLGVFAAATSVSAGTNPSSIAVADANGDGKADLVVASAATTSVIFLGTGTGTFTSTTSTAPANRLCAAAGDINKDGKTDIFFDSVPSHTLISMKYSGCY